MITSLSKIKEGMKCRIIWLLSPSDMLRKYPKLSENDELYVLQNLGNGSVIIRYSDHRYALSDDLTERIKVEPI
ncbi:MAG: ferrous iron transport protein A [Butyrivibrio sp.]|nr:ferrous iron transport protein A [Butyrivibrio sp.]